MAIFIRSNKARGSKCGKSTANAWLGYRICCALVIRCQAFSSPSGLILPPNCLQSTSDPTGFTGHLSGKDRIGGPSRMGHGQSPEMMSLSWKRQGRPRGLLPPEREDGNRGVVFMPRRSIRRSRHGTGLQTGLPVHPVGGGTPRPLKMRVERVLHLSYIALVAGFPMRSSGCGQRYEVTMVGGPMTLSWASSSRGIIPGGSQCVQSRAGMVTPASFLRISR